RVDLGPAPGATAPARLTPPGAEQLADHELGVQRAAYGEHFPGGPQHLGKQCVGRWIRGPGGAAGTAGRGPGALAPGVLTPASGWLATAALGGHSSSFADLG